jgi:hypothetical protein
MILTELIWPWPLTLGYFPKMGKTAKLMARALTNGLADNVTQ